jgi:DNA-binding PadR family transcriptional regulator
VTHGAGMRDVVSIRYDLLVLLSEGPRNGRQLREALGTRPGRTRPPPAAQVDTTLRRLARDGLVESAATGTDGQEKEFLITADGERELAGWLLTPPDVAAWPHDELAAKILVALRVPGTDVHELVQVHRRGLVELMQQWTRIKQDDAGDDLRLALAIDAQRFRLDSVIRWLDAADGRLQHAAARPAAVRPTAARPAADGHIRTSEADREDATARLRDHYAEGRLSYEELGERITAALNARTFGDLRRVLADLPASAPHSTTAGG